MSTSRDQSQRRHLDRQRRRDLAIPVRCNFEICVLEACQRVTPPDRAYLPGRHQRILGV